MINPRTPVLVAVGELTNRSDAIVDPKWAPDVLGSDLLWLYDAGQLTPIRH